MTEPIYLDYNATTPVAPQVVDAMLPWLREQHGNPSSDHPAGRRAAQAVTAAQRPSAAPSAQYAAPLISWCQRARAAGGRRGHGGGFGGVRLSLRARRGERCAGGHGHRLGARGRCGAVVRGPRDDRAGDRSRGAGVGGGVARAALIFDNNRSSAPAGEEWTNANGSLTFRMRFTDFTGKFVWHCHALDHEDLGIMELVEVVG